MSHTLGQIIFEALFQYAPEMSLSRKMLALNILKLICNMCIQTTLPEQQFICQADNFVLLSVMRELRIEVEIKNKKYGKMEKWNCCLRSATKLHRVFISGLWIFL